MQTHQRFAAEGLPATSPAKFSPLFMRSATRRVAILLLISPAPCLFGIQGCASTQQRVVVAERPATAPLIPDGNSREMSSPETGGPINTVAYREDESSAASSNDDPLEVNGPTDNSDSSNDADSTREGMTLQALEGLAQQHNPAIQQAIAVASKAAGIRTQVGLRPNPTIGYFGEEIGNGGAGGLHGAYVSQTFVRGDKLAWNDQVIGHDVDSVVWQIEAQRRRVTTDIRVQFYEALAAQKRLQLSREFRQIAEQAVSISRERIEAKVGTRPDVLQSEIQLSEIDLAIQQAQFEFEAAWKELAATIGMPDLAPTTLIGELSDPVSQRDADVVLQQIVSQSPLLAAAYARVNRARANLNRQRLQPVPNVTAQVGVGHDDGTGDEFANVQLSLPLPIHNENQGNIRAAHAEYCEATQNVERLRLQIRRDLARVMREYQIAEATVTQYEQAIIPRADETLQLMQEAQAAGQFDFLRVLTARRTFFDVNLKYVSALSDLAQANARIDGLLLAGGLDNVVTYDRGDDLRSQALSGQ